MERPKTPLADLFLDLPNASEEVRHALQKYLQDGVAIGWGVCRYGELGTGFRCSILTPLMVSGRDKPIKVGCTSMSSVWLGARGSISTMGGGAWGELGVPTPKLCPIITATETGIPVALYHIELPLFTPENMVVEIQGGFAYFAGLSVRGDVFLWGANNYAQCSRNLEERNVLSPQRRRIPGERVIEIACANYTVLALMASGLVYGWGNTSLLGLEEDIKSQVPLESFKTIKVGNEVRDIVIDPVKVKSLERLHIEHLRAGPWHAVAISKNGKVYSWGVGKNGRLGHGNEDDIILPKEITSINSKVIEVACGSFHTCFITSEGAAFLCGDNQGGQCGVMGEMMVTTCNRIYVPSDKKVISATCGRHHTLLLLETGEIITYGTGLGIGLGTGYGMRLVRGMSIADNYTSFSLSTGTCHNFALAIPKNLSMILLGLPHRGVPAALNIIGLRDGLLSAGLGQGFSILLSRRGHTYSMGLGGWGQLGIDLHGVKDFTPEKVPVVRHAMRVSYFNRTIITHVSAGIGFSIAVSEHQRVFAWGSNLYGQSGLGINPKEQVRISEPREIVWLADKMIIQVACGCYFVMALSATGDVYTWGNIECCGNGLQPSPDIVPKHLIMSNIGSESQASILLPVKVSGLTGIVSIAAGAWHALALNALGEMFTWGLGGAGRLGLESEEDKYIPTKINLRAPITKIGCGTFASFALTEKGKLYMWGANDHHQLSLPSSRIHSPMHVLDDIKEAAIGKYYSIVITKNHELKFTGKLETETGTYLSKSFNDTRALPPIISHDNMKAEGYIPLRVFAGLEHAVILMEKSSIPASVVRELHYALRDKPAQVIREGLR